jgi:hypothetical protein
MIVTDLVLNTAIPSVTDTEPPVISFGAVVVSEGSHLLETGGKIEFGLGLGNGFCSCLGFGWT